MKQHEREFFIALIRSGKYYIEHNNIKLVIVPSTIDQSLEAAMVYNEAYEKAYIDGMMNEEEMNNWMLENRLWTPDNDKVIDGLKNDLEKLKVEIFNNRNDSALVSQIRKYIRAGENQLASEHSKKNQYYQNTCEGLAASEKACWTIKNTTFYRNKNKLYDFDNLSMTYVLDEWYSSILSENKIRELARSEPWKSLWAVRENSKANLFKNIDNVELTYNQKNLIVWSQMYDNIQESMDCPSKEVIEDDDMLDGWFILQNKKRDREKSEQDFSEGTRNEKIKNAAEVFVVAKDKKDISKIENMNHPASAMIKKQRHKTIIEKGSVNHHDFADEKMRVRMEQTKQNIGKIKGG
jgi:hypothetical protein